MTHLTKIFAMTLGLAASATAINAQGVMDADGDGVYSYDELLVAYPDLSEEAFVAIDTNGDGAVDADEMAAAQESGAVPAEG